MQEIATREQINAPPTPISSKPPRISKRLRQAIELLETGECETQKAAAVRVGLSETWISRALSKSSIQAFIAERTRRNISTSGLARAGRRVIELVDASSEHVSLDASKHVLAIAGIAPPQSAQALVNINITPGYVIDLSGKQAPVIDGNALNQSDTNE